MSIAKEDKLVRGGDLATVASSLKTYIQNQVNPKFGSVYFDSETNSLLFFKNNTDRDSYIADSTQSELIIDSIIVSTSSNIQYRVVLYNRNQVSGQNNTIQIATNATELNLMVDFDVQMSSDLGQTYISTGRSARFKVYTYDANNVKTEIVNAQTLCFGGQQFVFNIRPYLSVGTTRVEVEATMDGGADSGFFIYQIIVSEMYIEESNNNWYNAIVENGLYDANYKLGGFKIVGSMSKILHIELYSGNTLVKSFEKIIGQSSYGDESPYYYTHQEGFDMRSDNSNLTTGIYMVKAYLTSDNLTSLPVIYNVMYVDSLSINSAQLVCVNNVAPIVYNYSSLTLCDYAIYDKGAATGDPHLLLKFVTGTTPSTKEDKDLENTTTGVLHNLNYTVEWLTEDTVNLFVNATLSLGSSSQILNIPIDNSATYPAETGAIFYLNATTRNNTDTNKTKIVNEATLPSTEMTPTWTKMSWVDGIDGWTVDDTGRKCLLVPAKSSMSLPYQILTGENITIEICYKVANVVDYDENVITIASNPTTAGFHGIRIRPTNVTVHSSADNDASKDTERGTNLADEAVHHLMITIANSYSGNLGKNLVTGYVDGSVGFQFRYDNGTVWANNVPLIIGSQYSDVYVYFIRVYNSLLGKSGIEKNYINSLNGLAVREAVYNQFYSIVKQSTHEITYENISKSNKNFFVVEMLNGATIPSRANDWTKETKGKSNFEMHFGEHPLWDFKLYNIETAGQGTTSMDYYRWNLRFRIDKSNDSKKIPIAYYNAPTIGLDGSKTYDEQEASNANAVFFDGGANSTAQQHPKVKRITAKINFASSMQSHKIGATRAYDAIRTELEITNPAQDFAASQDPELPKPVVAVYQYPAYGFSKTVSPQGVITYEYIGLFTIGPDKGDKPTFGYDIDSSIKTTLITLEGTDHSRRMAKFLYPWNANVEYRDSNECLNIVKGNGFDNGWEVGNCYDLDIGNKNATDQTAINTKLVQEFKPAYDIVYNNSTQIFPIALNTYGATAAATLTAINADIENFRLTQYDSRFTYADMEFWIEGEYVLYYYDIVQDKYVAGVNLVTDLNQGQPEGSTLDEKNEWFKTKRRARFKAGAENYWDIQDAIYHFLFILWFGATDNFAKNTYPYKMGNLSGTGRWCWRQDDLDTIFDIDNTGGQTKPYYIEYRDAHGGSPYFAGSSSVFWNLLFETYWEDYGLNKGIASMGKQFISAMANLGSGSNTLESCRNFINAYFWNNAQNYFNQAAYNVDTVYKYESAWLANGQDVDPLTQSLGNHYSAEKLWVDRRIIYMMSLFKSGAFGSYDDSSLGRISFRPKTISSFTVKPLMELYPAIIEGAGSPMGTSRTAAGATKEFTNVGAGDGNTTFYIQATDYLTSLGDWKGIELGTGSGGLGNVEIRSKKLKDFNIGDSTASNVTTNIPSVTFPNNKCLETINAENAESLTGSIDLSNCTRLISANFSGTKLTQVNLPIGSKVEHLYLPDTTKAIILKNLNFLQDLDLPSDLSGINTIQVENCTHQDALDMLRDLYNSDNSSLQYIRAIWSNTVNGTLDDMAMLANIKTNKDKNGDAVTNNYGGIAANGNTTNVPVIEGTIQLTTGLYSTDLETLGQVGTPEIISGTIVKAQTEVFGTLYIIYDSARVYIAFEDTNVESICMTNWSSDHIGFSVSDAISVTDSQLRSKFKGVTSISKFNEFKYFTGITNIGYNGGGGNSLGAFGNCTNLEEITLPSSLTAIGFEESSGAFKNDSKLKKVLGNCRLTTIGGYCFQNCSQLSEILTLQYVTSIGIYAFNNTPALEIDLNLPNLSTLGPTSFRNSGIKRIISLGNITSIPTDSFGAYGGCFHGCTKLESVSIPASLTSIGNAAFRGCTALTTITFATSTNNLAIGDNAFQSCDLSNTTLPERITSVAGHGFYGTNLAGALYLPNLTSIGVRAFSGTKITSITSLGQLVTLTGDGQQGYGPFQNCSLLTSVVIPATMTTIGVNVFASDAALTTVTFESSVNNLAISSQAFGKTDLSNTTLSTRITSIGTSAFEQTKLTGALYLPNLSGTLGGGAFFKTKITSITSLGNINIIGDAANSYWSNNAGTFKDCTDLTTVTLPNTLTTIGNYAFAGCTSLDTINLPSSITTIKISAFEGTLIDNVVNLPNLTAIGDHAFYGTKITGITSLGSLVSIPDASNTAYGNTRGVFHNCTELVSVTLPSTLTTIGSYAFNGCTNLETINFPSSLTAIGASAFYGCSKLTGTLTLPGPITLGENAFRNTGLTKVIFQGDVAGLGGRNREVCTFGITGLQEVEFSEYQTSSIAGYVFKPASGYNEITFTFRCTTPPTINNYTFDGANPKHIYVPAASVDTYKAASVWSNYASIIEAIPSA